MTSPDVDTVATPPADPIIHPTAIVDPTAELACGVIVGPYAIIESGVRVGEGTRIDSHARLARDTRVGRANRIGHGAVLGTEPQDITYRDEPTWLEIGDRNIIREYATLHRGTRSSGKTSVGHDNFIMAYAHVAHDCRIGNHVTLVNSVNMAGHVTIDDWAVLGGLVPVHQFVHIGCHAMIGGSFRVSQDVAPYALTAGQPLHVVGLNIVGLRRRGFKAAQLSPLRNAFRVLFKSELNTTQALDRVTAEVELTAEVHHLVEFIRASERGVTK